MYYNDLKTTKDYGLNYNSQDKDMNLVGYSDASFNNSKDATSTTGHVILLGTHVIHWKSRKQVVPSTSSCEAEI